MKPFQISLIVLVVTSALVSWFLVEVLQTRIVVVIVGVVWASVVTISVSGYMCFLLYSGKIYLPTHARDAKPFALKEIIASLPLLLGVIMMFYFLAHNEIANISKVLGAALILWLLLRFLLGRLLRSKKEPAD